MITPFTREQKKKKRKRRTKRRRFLDIKLVIPC